MKTFLLALLLLVGFGPAEAQVSPAPPLAASPALRIDSVAVLRQVYRKNRRNSRWGVLIGGYESGFGISGLASATTARQVTGGLLAGIGSFNMVLNIVRWARYSRRHEEETVRLLQHGRPLPRYAQEPYQLALTRLKQYVH